MPAVFYHRHQVLPEEVDRLGHVNNLRYLQWAVDAAVAHSAAQGWDRRRYQQQGAAWVVRSHQIEYLEPCYAGDEILVATWVAGFRRIRSLRKYRILRTPRRGTEETRRRSTAATAETWWAYVAIDSMAPRRVPPELRDAFEVLEQDPPLEPPLDPLSA